MHPSAIVSRTLKTLGAGMRQQPDQGYPLPPAQVVSFPGSSPADERRVPRQAASELDQAHTGPRRRSTRMGKLRLGVIGAGSWTVTSHLPYLGLHRDEVDFVIVNRRNPELLGRIKDRFGFQKSTTDWQDVIAEDLDIVVVASPPGSHWEQAKAALESGAAVLCEKPFTIRPEHAWDLEETVRRTGRQLIIAYGWNYRPMVVAARRLMEEEGGVGDIEQITIHMDSAVRELMAGTGSYPGAPGYVAQVETYSRPETSGGGYGQAQLTHALGIALWVTGLRGRDVVALMSAPLYAPVELHAAMSIRYASGAIGTVGGGAGYLGGADNHHPKNIHEVDLRVIGSKGQLHLDTRENILWRYRSPVDDVRPELPSDAGVYDCRGPIEALLAAGSGRPFENNSPAELGARTVEILDAGYRSAASGAIEHVNIR